MLKMCASSAIRIRSLGWNGARVCSWSAHIRSFDNVYENKHLDRWHFENQLNVFFEEIWFSTKEMAQLPLSARKISWKVVFPRRIKKSQANKNVPSCMPYNWFETQLHYFYWIPYYIIIPILPNLPSVNCCFAFATVAHQFWWRECYPLWKFSADCLSTLNVLFDFSF